MQQKLRICAVTGTRADYGLLYSVMREIQSKPDLQLQLIVTGMHLSPEFGLTYQEISKNEFEIVAKVEMLLSSDTPVGITKSIGLAVIGFADALERAQPDILLVLGDRYEILASVQAALIAKIPVAHIAGGDTTEGAFDESIRHAITKMSHLHFVTNEISAKRVRQLGENPDIIYNYGSPGIDQIKRLTMLSRFELEKSLDFKFREKNILVTFHPVTLDMQSTAKQFLEILQGIDALGSNLGIIFTMPNSDPSGRTIIQMIANYVRTHPHAVAYTSLGQLRYLSTISQVDAVVGNSSSGLYEVPSFCKPTVNIGDRQKGRLQATSIINCEPIAAEITKAIQAAFRMDCSQTANPYGDGNSATRIVQILQQIREPSQLLKKHFFDI
ncbi:GDP/UDP-N,N'-diacetylbacillosamine 2-epimerase (Hydrolyzing) [Tumidithrix helvetica PCC 7403]|uniref:UDP-N-acetylglucosamine 2-epimerase n=1 Tax=Tumidithrix helvetica TaxID=3457545 RepID=UPI003C914961